jgi:hypothetical protein
MTHQAAASDGDQAFAIPQPTPVNLVVNGVSRTLNLVPWTTLLDALRDHLDLTGTKKDAITANAVLAPCWWTAGASIPA